MSSGESKKQSKPSKAENAKDEKNKKHKEDFDWLLSTAAPREKASGKT